MVKIGKFDCGEELVALPVTDLIEDIPVDERHVQELTSSMIMKGQLSPLLVWKETKRIIDGAHRVCALKLAGKEKAICILFSCDEETFWSLRIINAITHQSVSFSRIVSWVREAFRATKWAKTMDPQDAFKIGKRGAAIHLALTPEERKDLTNWVEEKSRLWNLPPEKIGQMLKIAHFLEPHLISEIREGGRPGTITPSIAKAIAKATRDPNLQQELVDKVRREKLSFKDVQTITDQIVDAKTSYQQKKLLSAPYRRSVRNRQLVGQSDTQLQANLIRGALEEIIFLLPQQKPSQFLDERILVAITVMTIYLGKENTNVLEILQRENQKLKEETKNLSEANERKDQVIDSYSKQILELQEQLVRRD